MNEELKDIFFYSVSPAEILQHLLVSLFCSLIIALVYRLTYKGLSYSSSFVNSVIMLTLVMTVVIMVIGNNLATAFGLVGAMSIIRFRTALKDSSDIIFIFFALAEGLACGVGLFSVAIFASIFVGIIYYLIVKLNITTPRKRDFLLLMVIEGPNAKDFDAGSPLNKYCRKHQLVNVKALGEETHNQLELSFYVKLKKEEVAQDLVNAIKAISGVSHVNLFFDEE